MVISICNSNIRESGTQRPLQGLSPCDWGLGHLGPRKKPSRWRRLFLWSQQGMILRPPDYESGATNQLSYGTFFLLLFGDFCVGLRILSQSLPKGSSFLRRLSALKSLKNKLRNVSFW